MVLKKRLTTLGSMIKRPSNREDDFAPDADTPEANAARGVRLFCESGGANSGEEVLHLPTIVESAVASPAAAGAAAKQIRIFLSKDNYSRPHVQYNAVMLIRILADNPGQSFTKFMDKNFADTIKHLLRHGQDPSVSQILKETCDALDREKAYDINLTPVFAMWRKEKTLMANAQKQFGPRTLNAPPWSGNQGGSSKGLPPPAELVGRIEEARTSAKLLLQLVQSTPPNELLGNDLIKEFSDRCMTAQRSVQGYINSENPAPDDDTMLTLIETNEQLSLAASKHQRAVLQARRLQGPSPSPPVHTANNMNSVPPVTNTYDPPPQAPPRSTDPPANTAPLLPPLDVGPSAISRKTSPPNVNNDLPLPPALQAAPNRKRTSTQPPVEEDNPFGDHHSAPTNPPPASSQQSNGTSGGHNSSRPTRQRELTEEEEYARDYPVSTYVPNTPERQRNPRNSDVSPIAERGQVTYRY